MYKTLTIDEYLKNSKENLYNKPWEDLEFVCINGFLEEIINKKEGYQIDLKEFPLAIKDSETNHGFCLGSSFGDLVPNTEKLYGKKVNIYGLTTESYLPLYNLYTITKVEVLDENDEVLETYDSNEKSKANLRKYFNQMGLEIPEEFQE